MDFFPIDDYRVTRNDFDCGVPDLNEYLKNMLVKMIAEAFLKPLSQFLKVKIVKWLAIILSVWQK
jgi:hypothetical protein